MLKTHEELKLVLNSIVIKLNIALVHINYLSNKVMCYCFLACVGAELLINLTRH